MEQYQAQMAEQFFVEDPPAVEVVLEARPEEIGPLIAECIQEMGFDARYSPQGGYTVESGPGQAAAADLAMYTCHSSYVPLPVFYQPHDNETLERVFSYKHDVVWPCFAEAGYPLDHEPTWEEFREQYSIDRRVGYHPTDAPNSLFSRCDPNTPDDVLLPVE